MEARRMFSNCCCYYLNRNNLLLGWIILNLFVFVTNYYHYMTQPGYYYLRRILGHGLSVTRSSAAIINLSCALVLLPVCRTLNSAFHRILGKFSRFFLTCWFTRLKSIHIIIAITIVIASFVHSGGHVINAMNYSNYYNKHYTLINWATYKGESPALLILTSVVGVTGVLMLFLLTLMVLLSTSYVRQFDFDLFWGSHFLFIIFLVLFFIHPLKGVLKKQVNINDHIPGCKIKLNHTQSILKILNVTKMNLKENMNNKINFIENNNDDYINNYDDGDNDDILSDNICQSNPLFDNMKTQSWMWVAGTLIIYLIDLALRIRSRNCDNTFIIKSAKMLPGDVANIEMVSISPISRISSSSSCLNINIPSQYVLVQCPRLAPLEWHPFTVVNISKDTKGHCIINLLIKIRGDWTRSICNSSLRVTDVQDHLGKPLRLLIDGPFFSPMQNIVNSAIAICIAAGIGITPFAAILHHIINEDVKTMCQPFKIHLVWVIRTIDQLKWIQKLLIKLHLKLSFQKQLQRFNLILFVTKNYDPEILQESYFIKIRSMENVQIYYGRRPDWSDLLLEWKQYYERGTVRVFLSGPPKVVDDVQNVCNKLNRNNPGCRLKCIIESFG